MSGTTYVSIGESVAEYLADTVTYTALTVGTNAFYGLVPDEPDELVCVFERPGGSPLMTMTRHMCAFFTHASYRAPSSVLVLPA